VIHKALTIWTRMGCADSNVAILRSCLYEKTINVQI